MYANTIKPFFDVVLALVLLLFLLPILVSLTILLALHFKSNPLFFQKRIGKGEKPFWLWKFKTMSAHLDRNGIWLTDDERTGTVGNFLRRTGIDELPQLVNILKGEMSFIGPRPLLPEYLSLYPPFAQKRHWIKPGITGLAQVHGGNALAWRYRFRYDVFYVQKTSFPLDLLILWKTGLQLRKNRKEENIGPYKG